VPQLLAGDTSRNLRRVFRLMEELKAQGKRSDFKARRVHVIGAGVMGGDIAAWCASRGLEVTLQDREMKYIEPALKRAVKLFKRRLKKPDSRGCCQDPPGGRCRGQGRQAADVIIEASSKPRGQARTVRAAQPESSRTPWWRPTPRPSRWPSCPMCSMIPPPDRPALFQSGGANAAGRGGLRQEVGSRPGQRRLQLRHPDRQVRLPVTSTPASWSTGCSRPTCAMP
jgi:hypothetical protein